MKRTFCDKCKVELYEAGPGMCSAYPSIRIVFNYLQRTSLDGPMKFDLCLACHDHVVPLVQKCLNDAIYG